jgi:hypothetical protein
LGTNKITGIVVANESLIALDSAGKVGIDNKERFQKFELFH